MLEALPLELQLLTLQHVCRLDDLVHLYDALRFPSQSGTVAELPLLEHTIVMRIFALMQCERIMQFSVLGDCVTATEELRDTLSIAALDMSFSKIINRLQSERAVLRIPSSTPRLQFRKYIATRQQAETAQLHAADMLRKQNKAWMLARWNEASLSIPTVLDDSMIHPSEKSQVAPAEDWACFRLTDTAQLKASRYKLRRFVDRLYKNQLISAV